MAVEKPNSAEFPPLCVSPEFELFNGKVRFVLPSLLNDTITKLYVYWSNTGNRWEYSVTDFGVSPIAYLSNNTGPYPISTVTSEWTFIGGANVNNIAFSDFCPCPTMYMCFIIDTGGDSTIIASRLAQGNLPLENGKPAYSLSSVVAGGKVYWNGTAWVYVTSASPSGYQTLTGSFAGNLLYPINVPSAASWSVPSSGTEPIIT
jgi:hypothetical protein